MRIRNKNNVNYIGYTDSRFRSDKLSRMWAILVIFPPIPKAVFLHFNYNVSYAVRRVIYVLHDVYLVCISFKLPPNSDCNKYLQSQFNIFQH